MKRNILAVAAAAAFAAGSVACDSKSMGPVTPAISRSSLDGFLTGPGGTSLKADAPIPQSPIANVAVTTATPTLVISGGALMFSPTQPQYRFRVSDDTGTLAVDSGLVSGNNWTIPAPLSPTTKYTWIARAEYLGLTGPWSSPGVFTTPVAAGNDFGAWESTCQGRAPADIVSCVWNFVRPNNSVLDLEVTKRVAWLLRGSGGGLLLKSSGDNVVPWLGFNFSASRICFSDGHIFKIIADAGPGGANSPGYGDNDFVDVSLYFPARDPRLR